MPHTTDTTGNRPDGVAREGWVELGSSEELRDILGERWPVVIDKVHDRLTDEDVDILSRSPFCLLATSDAAGNCDVSPRGDTPGFTHVLDAATIALPDRPGNRRGDSFHNILDNPHAGLLYLIPGSKQVLRVNGRARILTDAPFFDAMTRDNRRPLLAIVLDIDEIYLHCSQSLNRSGVWKPESWKAT
ncbi:MSMEG_1061 family FMN-dependent PPOX-type flavoprotein [Streptomyces cadmiisoli]|uniref:MSMEG_1061 family FMN-dependent PPOX-type flavoprotein n=1 Tax=Streptomyces cadmiisoli TaxID=2184053 RepID=UPI00364B05A5